MNRVFIIGNLSKDVETRETTNGKMAATLSLAVNRTYSEGADYFNCIVWDKRAENCAKYLKKGSKVAIEGTLYNRSYEDKDGVKRNVTDVVANEVEFLTPKSAQGEVDEVSVSSQSKVRPQLEAIDDNQLPF